MEVIKFLVENRAHIKLKNQYNKSHQNLKYDSILLKHLLIEQGVDFSDGQTDADRALLKACHDGNVYEVESCLEDGGDIRKMKTARQFCLTQSQKGIWK